MYYINYFMIYKLSMCALYFYVVLWHIKQILIIYIDCTNLIIICLYLKEKIIQSSFFYYTTHSIHFSKCFWWSKNKNIICKIYYAYGHIVNYTLSFGKLNKSFHRAKINVHMIHVFVHITKWLFKNKNIIVPKNIFLKKSNVRYCLLIIPRTNPIKQRFLWNVYICSL